MTQQSSAREKLEALGAPREESQQNPQDGQQGASAGSSSGSGSGREERRGCADSAENRLALRVQVKPWRSQKSPGNTQRGTRLSAKLLGACANIICISRLVTFDLRMAKTELATVFHVEECGLSSFSEQVTPLVRSLPGKPELDFPMRM